MSEPALETVEQAAARWFARKRSGAMSTQEARALEVWLDCDPEHLAAFDAVARVWGGAEQARADPEVMAMREAAFQAHAKPARRVPGAVAASLAAGCILAAGLGGWAAVKGGLFPFQQTQQRPQDQEFRTGVGQTVTMTLADGSMVTLDTDTVLRTHDSVKERLAFVDKGRVFFRVAKDPSRPFIVAASGKTVTATGTAFDVRVDPERFEVTLMEGRVRVEAKEPKFSSDVKTTNMSAGTRLVALDDRHWKLVKIDVQHEMGWLYGQLRFDNEPIGEVAAELNRYSRKKIIVRDERVAQRPIMGAFTAGDVDEFVKAVQNYHIARKGAETEDTVELVAR